MNDYPKTRVHPQHGVLLHWQQRTTVVEHPDSTRREEVEIWGYYPVGDDDNGSIGAIFPSEMLAEYNAACKRVRGAMILRPASESSILAFTPR